MQIMLAHIGAKPSSRDPLDQVVSMYLQRCSAFARCEEQSFRSEDALFDWIDRQQRRAPAVTVLLDSRGRQMSSESFAEWINKQRDSSAQQIVFSIGPADGWSDAARKRATLLLSLGSFTLAHALARFVIVVLFFCLFLFFVGFFF